MKKLLSLFVTIFALLAVACGGDDVDKPAPKPGTNDPATPTTPFDVDITKITRGSVTFDVTPNDPTIDYLCSVYEKEMVDGYKKEEYFVRDVMVELTEQAGKKGYTLSEYMPEAVDFGDIVNVQFTGLAMETEYYVVVFGVKASGDTYVSSTEIVKVPFSTLAVDMSDCTFDVEAEVLYNNVIFNVKPSNKEILWYLCTEPKAYYDQYVGEGKMSKDAFYRKHFQDDINAYMQAGNSAEAVLLQLTHLGDLLVEGKGLYANTEYYYLIAGLIVDEEGVVITTDVTLGSYTTGDTEPSEMYFDIKLYDVQQMSVAFTVKPSKQKEPYHCQVQLWDGVSTAEDIMNRMVEQWGPGWMSVQADSMGNIDFVTKPKALPAAGTKYCIIVFGYSGGVTTAPQMVTFETPPGGNLDDLEISMTASSINPYGFTMNITATDPTFYYVASACGSEEYDEAKFIAYEESQFDFFYEGSIDFNPGYSVAETLDQYYYNGNSTLRVSGMQPETLATAYVYVFDIKTGDVVKTFTFEDIASTSSIGTVNPKIELVGYFSGNDEAGRLWGDAELTKDKVICAITCSDIDTASSLYTLVINSEEGEDFSDIVEFPDADMWYITSGFEWSKCSLKNPYYFTLLEWEKPSYALAYATDAAGKYGKMDRMRLFPTAAEKGDIKDLEELKKRIDEDEAQQQTRFEIPESLVVLESVKVGITTL